MDEISIKAETKQIIQAQWYVLSTITKTGNELQTDGHN